jgi:hypothetical protein
LRYFRKAASPAVNGFDSAPWFVTGKLLCGEKKFDEARAYLEKVREIDGDGGRWAVRAKELLDGIRAAC